MVRRNENERTAAELVMEVAALMTGGPLAEDWCPHCGFEKELGEDRCDHCGWKEKR